MTLVIADTHAQAEYWARHFELAQWRFVLKVMDTMGVLPSADVIAVGTLTSKTSYDIIEAFNARGCAVKFLKGT